jgi:outer membrane protein
MKKIIFITLFIAPIVGAAQKTWNLKDCIDYAMEHNIQIKQASLSLENNEMQLKQAKYNRLPSINAGLSDGFSFGR